MPKTPTLAPDRRSRRSPDDSIVLAVYAPFGSDAQLSRYPNPDPAAPIAPIRKQLLVTSLQKVAAEGVHVSALVDLFDDDTWLVEIPAGQPKAMTITSTWKQDMSTPQALAGFLRRVGQRFPCATPVLSLEGHGGGFVPDLDAARLSTKAATHWQTGGDSGLVRWIKSDEGTHYESEQGSPTLPMSSPELPMSSPELPATRLPMSTWALGAALRSAIKSGFPRPAVIHFSNCFNACFELLNTVAPYADYATAYANYDFFTAGEWYPALFKRLRMAGSATRQDLARWFAEENYRFLHAKGHHPTVGATVALARLPAITAAVDGLAVALTKALQPADDSLRQPVLEAIALAIRQAQQYDTNGDNVLEVPDQMSDLGSLAGQLLLAFPDAGHAVHIAANALQGAVSGLWQYGEVDQPWLDTRQTWDFSDRQLGLNIFCPDPDLSGVWDWRSPYYLSGKVDLTRPPAHRHVIDYLADVGGQRPRWVEFIVEYHRKVEFKRFLPALAPIFPIFNARFQGKDTPPPPPPPPPGTRPGSRR